MFFFIFFDISSLLLLYITPAIPRSSRLDLSKNILKNIDSYLNFRTLVLPLWELWEPQSSSFGKVIFFIFLEAVCSSSPGLLLPQGFFRPVGSSFADIVGVVVLIGFKSE